MKPVLRHISGVVISVFLAQLAWAAGNGQAPVLIGTGSLTVAGQGYWFQKTYEGGDLGYSLANDDFGNPLPDGVYRYEFTSFPQGNNASARQQGLEKLENTGMGRRNSNAKAVEIVSGRFEVQGGDVVFR